jgi:serine/threonine protein kinase
MKSVKNFPSLGKWNAIKELGEGASSRVYLASDENNTETVALKVFDLNDSNRNWLSIAMNNETRVLNEVKHPNIIEIKDQYTLLNCDSSDSKPSSVGVIVLEYAQRGELFDLLQALTCFPVELAQTYFKQIIGALQYLHKKNIVHRDIKAENILIDENFNLKLADFGYSSRDNRSVCTDKVGTSIYFAPEIHDGEAYSATQADLFAAGMILFLMVVGHMPFSQADKNDDLYKLRREDDFDAFWNFHSQLGANLGQETRFPESFKKLVWEMFDPIPDQRPTITSILNSDFMKPKELTSSEMSTLFTSIFSEDY